MLSNSETTESNGHKDLASASNGAVAKQIRSNVDQAERVNLPFAVLILPLAVILRRVLEFLHSTA